MYGRPNRKNNDQKTSIPFKACGFYLIWEIVSERRSEQDTLRRPIRGCRKRSLLPSLPSDRSPAGIRPAFPAEAGWRFISTTEQDTWWISFFGYLHAEIEGEMDLNMIYSRRLIMHACNTSQVRHPARGMTKNIIQVIVNFTRKPKSHTIQTAPSGTWTQDQVSVVPIGILSAIATQWILTSKLVTNNSNG